MRTDNSGQIVQTIAGVCAIRENYPLIGHSNAAGTSLSAPLGTVSGMFDRCLLDMAANDPQKGTLVIGASIRTDPYVEAPGAVTSQQYVWTPLNSWKYWPTSVYMKFRHVLRRTFYNPTNIVQTVFVTELRRRRGQLECEATGTLPDDRHYDYELIDQQPLWEGARTWWQPDDSTASGVLIYAPDTQGTGTGLVRMHEAGEMFRRFLYVRFGQYEQIQLASRGFTNVQSFATGTHPFMGLNRWAPEYRFNAPSDETGPTDPILPSIFGYNNTQPIRDNLFTSLEVTDDFGNSGTLKAQQNPWNSYSPADQIVTDDRSYYRYDPSYNPMRNPILRRLFRMRRSRYMIPPGGSATHIFRTGGTVHPFKSRVYANMRFYAQRAGMVGPLDPQLPYCLPFLDSYKPFPYAHTTPKQGGWYDVSAFIQVRGQMVYAAQQNSETNSVMQYGPARVVFHDRHEVRCKASSYGKPAIGGVRTHYTALSSIQTGYISTAPTAPPTSQFVNLATGPVFS